MFSELQEKYGEDFNWLEPTNEATFEAQLKKELVPLHPLFEIALKAVGKNSRNDDVLFRDEIDFYIIHLTWVTGTKDYPKYKKIYAGEIYSALEQDYLNG